MSQPAVSPVPDPAEPGVTPPGRPLARLAAQRAGPLPRRADRSDFLAVATPGAGKTAFALRVAAELLADRTITAVTVVTPTEHLKHQWAAAAASVGIALDPDFRNSTGATSSDYTGIAITYAGVAAHPMLHRNRTETRRTLVILDEVHHAGDARSWGEGVREAFEPATRRLTLTGTPFRSDDNPIPFVDYVPDGEGLLRSRADHAYGYSEALADGVVRPVVFLAYSGHVELADQRGRGDDRAARRAADGRADGAGLAHRAGPRRRVDPRRARPPRTGG